MEVNKKNQEETESGYVITEEKPSWVDSKSEKKIKENGFAEIRSFFQDHCPVRGTSARGKSLEEYGWNNTKPLKEKMLGEFTKQNRFVHATSLNDMREKLEMIDFTKDAWIHEKSEKICICTSGKDMFMKFFSHLRNSFAHSRFSIQQKDDDWFFILEDSWLEKRKNLEPVNKVSARMILRKSTLLKWIEIIEGGEKSLY